MLPWWMGVIISWGAVYVVAITVCSLVWLMFRRVRVCQNDHSVKCSND
ncbi:hypothetical protein SAMN05443507_14011 [Alicyclobacillus tolerans]|uniref:Uncharacterized protein n=1 Tax=Alicyclobacillus tolerans TaxID=90970 RepID=A0A1M6Y0W3_9BACL|nr:hypothetical protein SAMN05443507_14011 [Alicyclobacillus montanus]